MKRRTRLRLGIYGGTFDPPHLGHILLARDALEQARLDAVLFVPCAQSPLKRKKPRATDAHRLAMLRLVLKGELRFWLSRCELDRPGPSYAFDTAAEIGEAFPRATLFWLIGADQLATLPRWYRAEELVRRVTFLLFERGERPAPKWKAKVLSLPRARRVDISATEIRDRVKSRLPIDYLVPASVAAYIERRRLYRS
ncbi:MAG TPA: nicotinate-nucleotide adenylyltransferase [Candidatus Methylacidiphilales bacterium]|nr:nicotinate-nucleotide adenylyltransferase [Candidatus Methylacidiphilales bacterium]